LFSTAIAVPRSNVVELAVQQPPTAAYMSGFLLPLCYQLPTTSDRANRIVASFEVAPFPNLSPCTSPMTLVHKRGARAD
jgi:hypothetical protein